MEDSTPTELLVLVNIINEHGAYPTRNFQEAYFPDADEQSGETLVKNI